MDSIRVLIADDSPTSRTLIRSIVEGEPDLRLVGEAVNGEEAVEMTNRLRPDVVLMDVHMPILDGIAATRAIMARAPTPIVVVSAVTRDDVDLSLTATQAGALIALPKPDSPSSPRFEQQRREIVAMVRAMAQVKVVRRWNEEAGARPKTRASNIPRSVEVVAIAASTGGPAAVREMLGALPRSFPAPLVLVQHIARDFTEGLVHWLAGGSNLPVRLASEYGQMEPGVVYVAPDDHHTGVRRDLRIQLSSAPPIQGFRPSANFLFNSLASSYGDRSVGIILTGMGSDGVSGLLALREAGGYVIGQDERTSVIFGMASEAWRRNAVDELLPLPRIASRLMELVQRRDG